MGCLGTGYGRVCLGLAGKGELWPWQPLATGSRGKHRLSKGALFPVGAQQFQPAFQTWGGEGGEWRWGWPAWEEMSRLLPPFPWPQAYFLEAPVSRAPA